MPSGKARGVFSTLHQRIPSSSSDRNGFRSSASRSRSPSLSSLSSEVPMWYDAYLKSRNSRRTSASMCCSGDMADLSSVHTQSTSSVDMSVCSELSMALKYHLTQHRSDDKILPQNLPVNMCHRCRNPYDRSGKWKEQNICMSCFCARASLIDRGCRCKHMHLRSCPRNLAFR